VTDEIDLLRRYETRVLGLALNHEGLDADGRTKAQAELERETGLPVVWPLLGGVAALVPTIRAFVAAERNR
jgi:uncharacterized NAD-dependent epimerase/dehydratase family protein